MDGHRLPFSYRWFLAKGLTKWEPWYFIDDAGTAKLPPRLSQSDALQQRFVKETGAPFEVYLFARRQDQDEFAFFVVNDGVVEDRVVTTHLTFTDNADQTTPPRREDVTRTFLDWIRETALADVVEWISFCDERDL